jgi:hypothetical protein
MKSLGSPVEKLTSLQILGLVSRLVDLGELDLLQMSGLIQTREDPSSSPVFSNTTGFGSPVDHCVEDGPMTGLRLPYYGVEHPNCIWRSLPSRSTDGEGVLSRDKMSPYWVETIVSQQTYEDFLGKLDMGPGVQVPNGIAGTFLEFTAPNDPLFFLHHRLVHLGGSVGS